MLQSMNLCQLHRNETIHQNSQSVQSIFPKTTKNSYHKLCSWCTLHYPFDHHLKLTPRRCNLLRCINPLEHNKTTPLMGIICVQKNNCIVVVFHHIYCANASSGCGLSWGCTSNNFQNGMEYNTWWHLIFKR